MDRSGSWRGRRGGTGFGPVDCSQCQGCPRCQRMQRTAAATYIVTVTTKTVTAAATDHQIRAAMTGSPTSSQAPTARMSIPLALRSANHSASRITRRHGAAAQLLGSDRARHEPGVGSGHE